MRLWLLTWLAVSLGATGAEKVSPEVFRTLKTVQEQLNSGRPAESLSLIERIQAKSPTEKALLSAYASYAYLALSRYQEAAEAAQEALVSPELPKELRPKLQGVLGQAQLQRERFQEAAQALEAADSEPQLRYLAAYAYYRLRQYEQAAKILESLLASSPTPPKDWQQLLLACYIEGGRYDQASNMLAKQLVSQPHNADLWQQWLALKLRSRQPHEALAAMVLAWHAGQLDSKRFLDLARLYAASGIPEKAARLLASWRQEKRLPEAQDALPLEAALWLAARERQKALSVLEHIASLTGKGSDWLAAARIAAEIQSWQKTAQLAQKALQAGLSDPAEAELWLGIAAYHLGDLTTAKNALTRIQHSHRLAPHARYWLACLDKMRRCR
ncbi:MAG: tetratricopeptide repeat protein [Methylohalobius sp.]